MTAKVVMAALREAAEADYPEIVALTNRAFRATGPQASWNVEDMIEGERINLPLLREDVATPGAQLLIWRDEVGEHLGHVRLDEGADGDWFLGLLTVRSDRQDSGLGRALLAGAEAWARDRGARRMSMTVIHQRETLIAWYVRRGYRVTGRTKPFPYDDTRFGRARRADLYFDVLDKDVRFADDAPYHAHAYHRAEQRAASDALHARLTEAQAAGEIADLLMVGKLRERPVGPHPLPQFEIHFLRRALPQVLSLIAASGLTALAHPLTDDDLADHTTLATWIGEPLDLDLSVMDAVGVNQGVARFAQRDF